MFVLVIAPVSPLRDVTPPPPDVEIVTPPVEADTEIPEPAVTEVTPALVTVRAPVVADTEIPVPAETELTLAFVLTGATVWVDPLLNVSVVLFIDNGMSFS